MTDWKRDDAGLDAHFAAARRQDVPPSADFMARVLGDATAVQAGWATAAAPVARAGLLAQVLAAIGGWPAVAGLAAASAAGVWIGVAGPGMVGETMASYLDGGSDAYLVELMPEYDFELSEG